MPHIQMGRTFQLTSTSHVAVLNVQNAFPRLQKDTCFIKIEHIIQILELIKSQKFVTL